ncbi:quinon protein alcohol dehydrogenase-like superfamily [Obelidium mucronatum]|nr:quinon protein alcohol dehydrogenase-like superfamily [Obelidium mucronatum]
MNGTHHRLVDKLLFVGSEGCVTALDSNTGKYVWNISLQGTGFGNPTALVQIIPHPLESTLLVATGANLRSFSAHTGEQLWENKLIGLGVGYPAITEDPEDIAYVASSSGIKAITLKTGAEIWSLSKMEWGLTKPFLLIEDGALFAAGNGRVYALDALTGGEIWNSRLTHDGNCTLATMRSGNRTENVPLNRHYVSSSSKPSPTDAIYFGANGYINALSKETGNPFPIPRNAEISLTGVGLNSSDMIPLAHSDLVLVASGINLRAYDLRSGNLIWENQLKGMGKGGVVSLVAGSGVPSKTEDGQPPEYSFEAVEGCGSSLMSSAPGFDSLARVLYIALNGKVRAIHMKNGKEIWNYTPSWMEKSLDTNIFFEDDSVFVAGSGMVACLDGRTGKVVWSRKSIRRGLAFIATVRSGNGETNRSSLYGNILKQIRDQGAATTNSQTIY